MDTAVAIPILTARSQRINNAHRMTVEYGKAMLSYAIEAGEELLAVKKELPHGEFQKWCAENLTFSYRQAAKYMRLAKCVPQGTFETEAGINAVLDVHASRRVEPQSLDTSTAQRLLKLAAMANGGNEHEEVIAQEMLDKLAARFGMTGEEAHRSH